MLVKLKFGWFAPGAGRKVDGRPMSGMFYRPGIHDLPDSLLDQLPKDAKVLDKETDEYVTVKELSLRDYDTERAAGEQEQQIHDKFATARAALALKRSQKAAAKRAGE